MLKIIFFFLNKRKDNSKFNPEIGINSLINPKFLAEQFRVDFHLVLLCECCQSGSMCLAPLLSSLRAALKNGAIMKIKIPILKNAHPVIH